jgi:hypothetical protein
MRSRRKARGSLSVGALACVAFGWTCTGLAQDDRETVTVEQLHEELAERDTIIIELLNRIEALEAEQGSTSSENGPGNGPGQADARPAEPDSADTGEGTSADGFDVEQLQAERALERGLVERGARLLAPGQIEFSPRLTLYHDEGMFPVALMTDDVTTVGEVERTFDLYERRADVRFGLPAGMQLEIGVPYLSADQRAATGINGSIQSAMKHSGSGNGDAALSLAKAFGADSAGGARIIGRLSWLTGNGDERDGMVFLGGGTSGVNAQATAYWRRDPVVFLVGGGYTHFEEENSLQPGDGFRVSLGLGLAISPEAALIFSLDQMRTSEFTRSDMVLPGTDRLSSSLGISAQTLIGQRSSLGVDVDVGVTDDAADYRFSLSFSSRISVH